MVGMWKVTELAREGDRSLLKLGVLLERDDGMAAVSDIVWRCMALEGVYSLRSRNTKEKGRQCCWQWALGGVVASRPCRRRGLVGGVGNAKERLQLGRGRMQ